MCSSNSAFPGPIMASLNKIRRRNVVITMSDQEDTAILPQHSIADKDAFHAAPNERMQRRASAPSTVRQGPRNDAKMQRREIGGEGGTRTPDPVIMSHVL